MKKSTLIFTVFFSLTVVGQGRFEIVKKNTMDGEKFGVFDKQNSLELIPAVYDNIGAYSEGTFTVLKDKKVGVIDTLNNIVIPILYTTITDCIDDRFFILNAYNKWAMTDGKGIFLTEFKYDNILGFQYGVVRAVIGDKIGYLNNKGKQILPFDFHEGYDCYGSLILIYGATWKSLGFDYVKSDILGNEISRGDIGMSGKMPVIYNDKGQLIYKGNTNEKIIFVPDFEIILISKYFPNFTKTYHKIIDKQGKELISYNEQYYLSVKDDWIEIKADRKQWQYGIIDFKGNVILKPIFSEISKYSYNGGNLARVYFLDRNYFYIDRNMNCIEFGGVGCFSVYDYILNTHTTIWVLNSCYFQLY